MSFHMPRIVAHRGNAAEFPENTLPALRSALELGITHVEFDVQLTADHVPVLLHDASLGRTSGLEGDVLAMTWRQVAGMSAGQPDRFGDRFRDVRVPSLSQAVGMLRSFPEAVAFVELKRASLRTFGPETVVARVCELLQPVADQCVVISFDRPAVEYVRKTARLPIGWVLSDLSAATARECETLQPEFLFCDHRKLEPAPAPLWQGSWQWVIYEVTTREQALALAARGAGFVESMEVRKLARELKENRPR